MSYAPNTALLPEIFALHGHWRACQPALVCEGQNLDCAEFNKRMNQVANGLKAMGLNKGDRISVLMANGISMAEVLFGIMKSGCVSVPINLSVADSAIGGMISDSDSCALFATADQARRIDSAGIASEGPIAARRISTGEARTGWLNFTDWSTAQAESEPDVSIEPNDSVNIIYSSGTTGEPKGIVHCHQTRLNFARDASVALHYHGEVRTLISLGMFSNISWVSMLCTLLVGGCLVITRKFEPRATLQLIQDERVSHTSMVPLQYQKLVSAQREHRYDLSSLRAPMSCGSSLHPGTKKQVMEYLSPGIIELYGLTEGPVTTIEPGDSEGREGSVGKPTIGAHIRLLDENNNDVEAGQAGEILGYNEYMMSGYHNRPDATTDVIWTDESGRPWLRTGDIGKLDQDGFLYIVGRKKDMIISGGQNIYPEDIEFVIMRHEAVAEVAVVGVQSHKWGETPLAVIVPEVDERPDPDAITKWCNERLGKQQRIAGARIVDSLPRNPNGKILKRELRQQFKQLVF